MNAEGAAYICGPFSELDLELQDDAKKLYILFGNICYTTLGIRSFVPADRYDPVATFPGLTSEEIAFEERDQIEHRTRVMIVIASDPKWDGGEEVRTAIESGVPLAVFQPYGSDISPVFRKNPAVLCTLPYDPGKIPETVRSLIQFLAQFVAGKGSAAIA